MPFNQEGATNRARDQQPKKRSSLLFSLKTMVARQAQRPTLSLMAGRLHCPRQTTKDGMMACRGCIEAHHPMAITPLVLRLRLSTMSAPPVFTALRPERTLSALPAPLVPLPTLMVTMPPRHRPATPQARKSKALLPVLAARATTANTDGHHAAAPGGRDTRTQEPRRARRYCQSATSPS